MNPDTLYTPSKLYYVSITEVPEYISVIMITIDMISVNLYNVKSSLSLVERSIFGTVAELTLSIVFSPNNYWVQWCVFIQERGSLLYCHNDPASQAPSETPCQDPLRQGSTEAREVRKHMQRARALAQLTSSKLA